MKKVNSITLCREYYKNEEQFTEMIGRTIKLLADARYIMTCRYDEPGLGIFVIEYDHDDQEFGGPYPYWLTPDEYYSVEWENEKHD